MKVRKPLTNRVRFEVFKRDTFTCQYCGAKAPDVVLHVDHIEPVASGGSNDILNLVTSCESCNGGKGAVRLSDESAVEKSRKQAELVQKRLEQIEMIAQWHKELLASENLAANKVVDNIGVLSNSVPNDLGMSHLAKWVKKFGLAEILEASTVAFRQYYRGNNESWEHAFMMIPRIAKCQQIERTDPILAKAMLYRGILRKRLLYVNYQDVLDWLTTMLCDLGEEETGRICQQAKSWTNFCNLANEALKFERKYGKEDGAA